jgi:hypothetical protein
MTTEASRLAKGYALDCITRAETDAQGSPPDPDRELRKAQVYATLAVAEALEDLPDAVGAVRSALLVDKS